MIPSGVLVPLIALTLALIDTAGVLHRAARVPTPAYAFPLVGRAGRADLPFPFTVAFLLLTLLIGLVLLTLLEPSAEALARLVFLGLFLVPWTALSRRWVRLVASQHAHLSGDGLIISDNRGSQLIPWTHMLSVSNGAFGANLALRGRHQQALACRLDLRAIVQVAPSGVRVMAGRRLHPPG